MLRPIRIALATLISSLIISAVAGITIILVGDFDQTEIRILATSGTLTGFSILTWPSFSHLERARYKALARTGILSSLVLFLMVLLVIWGGDVMKSELYGKTLGTLGIVAFSVNHILAMLMVNSVTKTVLVSQCATMGVITTLGVLIVIAIWTKDMPEQTLRIFGTLAVLDTLGTIAVPLLARASKSG